MSKFDPKELFRATRPFAHETVWRSWWYLASTVAALGCVMVVLCSELYWLARLPFSVVAGLILIRLFVLFHDHQHGAILRQSKLADLFMVGFGLATLNPPSVWKRSHDHHHLNNCKSFGPNVGSFPLVTVETYAKATFWQRLLYAAARHPLTIALGYITVFFLGMCLRPLIANPRRHFDAALSLGCHLGILTWLAIYEIDDFWLAAIIPFLISSGLGAYLFFAQHNFPGAKVRTGPSWNYALAALHSSSFIRMGRLMCWFTGNIGYHHVHHLNSKIPFYRLPETMNEIEELRSPTMTSLHPRDILACLRLKLWDPQADKLVGWQAKSPAPPTEIPAAA